MGSIRPVLIASVIVSALAAASLAAFADLAVTHRNPTAMTLDRPAAVILSVSACLCWLTCRRDAREHRRELRDRDRTILIRALSRTAPMPRPDR